MAPFFIHLNWIFFVPRLTKNLFFVGKHLFAHKGMTAQEKSLGFATRLIVQCQRRWFEILTDSVWLTFGILNAFTLLVAPVGLYWLIGMALYDFALSTVRLAVVLRNYFIHQKQTPTSLLPFLSMQYQLDKKRLIINFCTNGTILMGMLLALPSLGVSSLPFVGALLILLTTAIAFRINSQFGKEKPPSGFVEAKGVLKQGFFSLKSDASEHPSNEPSPSLR